MSAISTRPKDLETQYRHGSVFKLRIAGHSFDEIASQLGYRDRSGPFLALKRDLESNLLEPAEEYRSLELARLDAIWKPLFERFQAQIQAGGEIDLKLVDRLINTVHKQAAVAGLMNGKPAPVPQSAPGASPEVSREQQVANILDVLRARLAEQAMPMVAEVIDHDAAPAQPESNGAANGTH